MQDIAGGHSTILMNQAKRNENNDECRRGHNEKRADFIMKRTNWWHEVVNTEVGLRTAAAVSGASISHLTIVLDSKSRDVKGTKTNTKYCHISFSGHGVGASDDHNNKRKEQYK